MGLPERLKFLSSPSSEPKLADYKEIPDELQAKYRSHHPAGTLIILYPSEAGSVNCEELQPEMTDRLLLHKSMAGDHSMNKYLGALDNMAGLASGDVLLDASDSVGRLPK